MAAGLFEHVHNSNQLLKHLALRYSNQYFLYALLIPNLRNTYLDHPLFLNSSTLILQRETYVLLSSSWYNFPYAFLLNSNL
jgi:hypothetical protein